MACVVKLSGGYQSNPPSEGFRAKKQQTVTLVEIELSFYSDLCCFCCYNIEIQNVLSALYETSKRHRL